MATINFPIHPVLNQQYAFGNNAWFWDGVGWQLVAGKPGNSAFVPIPPMVFQHGSMDTHADVFAGQPVNVLIYPTSTNNVNLFTAAGSPSAAVTLVVIIPAGTVISSATPGTGSANAALYTGTGWNAGSKIIIMGAGTIVGLSGAGGTAGAANGVGGPGGTGGDALYMDFPVTLQYFSGIIAGGAGGGGGGGGGTVNTGGAGGAGAGSIAANGTAGAAGNGTGPGTAGSAGTAHATAGGNGGNSTGIGGGGGGGGGGMGFPGGAGGKGDITVNAGGAAGPAGNAIRENGHTLTGSATTTYGTVG